MNSPSRLKSSESEEVTTAFGTVIVERPAGARTGGPDTDAGLLRPGVFLIGICGAAIAFVSVVQLLNLPEVMDPTRVLTAGFAKPVAAGYALAVIGLIAAAAWVPARLLGLPAMIAGSFASLILVGTLTLGGEAWSFAFAVLTFSACWMTGNWTLRALRVPTLAAMPPVAWLAGSAVVGVFLQLSGRAGLLRWWTVGAVVLVLGALGLHRLVTIARPLAAGVRTTLAESRLAAGCAAVILLLLGMAALWTAAPEIMYDALYFKAWLPSEWARAGEISALRDHAMLNVHGYAQVLAIPGHLFGAEGVGRYMQWLAFGFLPASIWWFLRSRTHWAPLAAVLVAVTPALFWQATTAFDDAILVLAGLILAIAVVAVLERPQRSPLWEGAAIGLLAGACVNLKLTLAFLAFGLALAYLLVRPGGRAGALAGLIAGGVVASSPALIARWVDIGNPVFPSLQGVFDSPYWGVGGGGGGLAAGGGGGGGDGGGFVDSPLSVLSVIWDAAIWGPVTDTVDIYQFPVGTYGVLTLAVVASILVGAVFLLRRRGTRGLIAVWGGLLVGFVGWYDQLFLKPRYLLPLAGAAVLMLGLAARGEHLPRRAERASLVAVAVIAALLWPATLAQFWNVPGKDAPLAAALNLREEFDYERESMPERDAVAAFDAIAPPGATAVTFAHQRLWLSDGRDLQLWWELHTRLQLNGASLPATAEEALRRIRATGTDWALVRDPSRWPGDFPYLRGTIARYGELTWAGGDWSLFRFVDEPRNPPIGPPPDNESFNEAQNRIATTIASGDCERINGLYMLAGAERRTDAHCQTLINLGERKRSGTEVYGSQAAVVDYSRAGAAAGSNAASLALIRDADGLFHIAHVATHDLPATVDFPLGRGADATVQAVFDARKEGDCASFLEVTNPAAGVGTLPDPEACVAIASDALQLALERAVFTGSAFRPELLGGNGFFAFYGLDTPTAYLVIVLAKSDSDSAVDQTPRAAPDRYGYLDSYSTNTAIRPGSAP